MKGNILIEMVPWWFKTKDFFYKKKKEKKKDLTLTRC